MNVQIKNRFTGAVLFECEAPDGLSSGLQMRHALEKAVTARATLAGAYLAGAYLGRANLAGASLDGANLSGGEKLFGERPIFQVGPIGSRCDFFIAYITNRGLRFDAGCQRQITREKFEERLAEQHGYNEHAKEYRAALALFDMHAEIWTPENEG